MDIRCFLSHNLVNIPGWHTNRKIVVIESDDWGSIRMPSREVYEEFLKQGIAVDKDPYCKYDSLASPVDLEALFDTLRSVKDKYGNPAVLTADTVVANPVFEKIKASGFSEYFYEPFTETLKRNAVHEGSFQLWKQGMNAGVFHPQFHGREHLNVNKWMKALQDENGITRKSFELGTFGLTSTVDPSIKLNYMGAFNSAIPLDILRYDTILKEGLNLFEKLFGYRSESFIATTYTWNPEIEKSLMKYGVRYLQGMVVQKIPLDDDTTFSYKRNNFTGRRSANGLTYLTRNCYYEPSQIKKDWISDCLNRVTIAFRWGKPAIISMHRLNVIGSLDENNRTVNLRGLKTILTEIVKRWSDVEFMSSDQLGRIICN